MSEFWETILDAFIDSVKILPILLIVYFLIELLEYKNVLKFEKSKLLKGKASPVMGALFGCVPQCGFSVVTTDLYSKKAVSVGALVAVYLATSDEALPIMLSSPSHILDLLLLIGSKIVLGIAIGYLSMFLYSKIFKKPQKETVPSQNNHPIPQNAELKSTQKVEIISENTTKKQTVLSSHSHKDLANTHHSSDGCCHHNMASKKFEWLHPLIHCLKIFAYILVVNLVLGITIYFIGEENFLNFLQSSYVFQPLLAILIGIIPNCAASVLITELYLAGGLSFGSILAGLCVNSGIAIVLLLKQNKNWKENLFIILMLIVPSLCVGYGLHFIPIF